MGSKTGRRELLQWRKSLCFLVQHFLNVSTRRLPVDLAKACFNGMMRIVSRLRILLIKKRPRF